MAKKTVKAKSKNVKRKSGFNKKEFSLFMLVFAAVGAVTLWVSLAAPHNGGGKSRYTGSLTLEMVTDVNSDGLPNWGDTITLKQSSNYPLDNAAPWSQLSCYQGTTLVYSASTGYGAGYPWPWSINMQLSSNAWTGGAADCHAKLYYYDGHKYPTIATLDFHVNP
jgi:hypothetical protein